MEKYTNSEILHKKGKDGVEYLEFKCLNELNVKNAIFLRHGGVSEGIYSSLNLRISSDDDKGKIAENFSRAFKAIGITKNDVCKAYQAHTDSILDISCNNKEEFLIFKENTTKADAYVVKDKGIFTLISTADCVPVIIYDMKNKVICNIHSGWKGTIQKISLKALRHMMSNYTTKPEDVVVCLGPAIAKCCFTSRDEEFIKKFSSIWQNTDEYVTNNDGVFHIDMKYCIISDLLTEGVLKKNIHNADICTKCHNEDFYSYRGTTTRNEEDYATFATIVGLE